MSIKCANMWKRHHPGSDALLWATRVSRGGRRRVAGYGGIRVDLQHAVVGAGEKGSSSVRIVRDPSPVPAMVNRENLRLDISHAEGVILQRLMLEVQGIKGWCLRDRRVQELVTTLVVNLPAEIHSLDMKPLGKRLSIGTKTAR